MEYDPDFYGGGWLHDGATPLRRIFIPPHGPERQAGVCGSEQHRVDMPRNFYENIPAELPEELFETLASGTGVRIERIVSRGHSSEPGFWYDQEEAEWVMVLKGEATLRFAEGETEETVHLKEGDWLNIPARRRHRVERTCGEGETIWIAVFYVESESAADAA